MNTVMEVFTGCVGMMFLGAAIGHHVVKYPGQSPLWVLAVMPLLLASLALGAIIGFDI